MHLFENYRFAADIIISVSSGQGIRIFMEKILVVDDERDITDLIKVYLKNENHTVFKSYTAEDALRCIETQELDLAILDVMLPGADGFSLCQKNPRKLRLPRYNVNCQRCRG